MTATMAPLPSDAVRSERITCDTDTWGARSPAWAGVAPSTPARPGQVRSGQVTGCRSAAAVRRAVEVVEVGVLTVDALRRPLPGEPRVERLVLQAVAVLAEEEPDQRVPALQDVGAAVLRCRRGEPLRHDVVDERVVVPLGDLVAEPVDVTDAVPVGEEARVHVRRPGVRVQAVALGAVEAEHA